MENSNVMIDKAIEERVNNKRLVEYYYERGCNANKIMQITGLSKSTVDSICRRYDMDKEFEFEAANMRMAPKTIHRREIVVVNGHPYLDITDYIVDCGA